MRTRLVVRNLGKEYLEDKNYEPGFISNTWIARVTKELNLMELSDEELENMWDIVFLTLQDEYMINRINNMVEDAIKWSDVKSAFTEVINIEARRRRGDVR